MQINYKAVGASSYTTLVDEAVGGIIETWQPSYSLQNQSEPLASSGETVSAFNNYLGNVVCSLPMKIQVSYGSRAAALAASRTIPTGFLQLNHFEVVQDGETQYFPNATMESCTPLVEGESVTFTFQFKTQMVTATAP